jgi:starch synthase (maltosyl-transferring)
MSRIPANPDGRQRVVIERVTPQVDCGRFAVKAVVGDVMEIQADVFGDGHDLVRCRVLHRGPRDKHWREVEMSPLDNDRWSAKIELTEIGDTRFMIEGWVDHLATWRKDMTKRIAAVEKHEGSESTETEQQMEDIRVAVLVGADLIDAAAKRALVARGQGRIDFRRLEKWASGLRHQPAIRAAAQLAMDDELLEIAERYPGTRYSTKTESEFHITVDRERARFSSWYEFFPRSFGATPGEHGSFRSAEQHLEYIASLGFNVAYVPPIHPIGESFRKGKNNSVTAESGDVGSPWAIGGKEGGHKALHPQLGTMEDFEAFRRKAEALGMEIAMDIAYQCAPEHPWVQEHPEFFKKRPDGSIQYAENPPKKYQDIYPIEFESAAWRTLWRELRDVIVFWAERGIRIFRVDNPHTKAFPFWEWMIADVKHTYPDAIFLAEAFTRPKVMYRLAKLGFTQSYTYFTWRNTKAEFEEYFTELNTGDVPLFFRPNLWPNTPDILHDNLQNGTPAAFKRQLVLAATLSGNYGLYGPAFELMEHVPARAGSEEYLNSEKYELKSWDLGAPNSLAWFLALINRIRNREPALQDSFNLHFHPTSNDMLMCYSKQSRRGDNTLLMVVNFDHKKSQNGMITLDLTKIGLQEGADFRVEDLLTGASYRWHGESNFVELRPAEMPAHILRIG